MNGVLVTGASSGIGLATVRRLAHAGYFVFAGVRTQAGAERVCAAHECVRPLLFDVCRRTEIAQAMEDVERARIPLHAIVNNAGIAVGGPLEYVPLDRVQQEFEVNVFGALAVTQAALPLLRRTRGRVIFISSISGQIASPFVGAYAASKFAVEALADALRMELAPFGLNVSVIQPGNVRTPMWQKGRLETAQLASRMSEKALERYGAALDALVRRSEQHEQTAMDPAVVAEAVLAALHARRPRARYAVGPPAPWQRRMAALLPERLRDRVIAGRAGPQ